MTKNNFKSLNVHFILEKSNGQPQLLFYCIKPFAVSITKSI